MASCQEGAAPQTFWRILNQVTAAVDEGKSLDAIFIDFAKAFDKFPRERLFKKIRSHGIGGKLWQWIKNWFSGRSHRVILNVHELLGRLHS
jgi:hypothetical protein